MLRRPARFGTGAARQACAIRHEGNAPRVGPKPAVTTGHGRALPFSLAWEARATPPAFAEPVHPRLTQMGLIVVRGRARTAPAVAADRSSKRDATFLHAGG